MIFFGNNYIYYCKNGLVKSIEIIENYLALNGLKVGNKYRIKNHRSGEVELVEFVERVGNTLDFISDKGTILINDVNAGSYSISEIEKRFSKESNINQTFLTIKKNDFQLHIHSNGNITAFKRK